MKAMKLAVGVLNRNDNHNIDPPLDEFHLERNRYPRLSWGIEMTNFDGLLYKRL